MNINFSKYKIIDLTQTFAVSIPVPPGLPHPSLDIFMSRKDGNVANVEILNSFLHAGTHMDAPYHFFSDLAHVDELVPDCLIGTAVIIDLSSKIGNIPIEAADIQSWEQQNGETIQPGDIALLRTDHSKKWGRGEQGSAYWKDGWPFLAHSAVDYLAELPIKAIGVETFDPDWVDPRHMVEHDFISHRVFLPKGILIIENLTNLDLVPTPRCTILALPLKLEGCSGSPLRVVALVEKE
jgi:arylformamidase